MYVYVYVYVCVCVRERERERERERGFVCVIIMLQLNPFQNKKVKHMHRSVRFNGKNPVSGYESNTYRR